MNDWYQYGYYSSAVPVGRGLSASSVESVLRAGVALALRQLRQSLSQQKLQVARNALREERAGRDFRGIAAQDVYSIVYGGVSLMQFSGQEHVEVQSLTADEEWLADHLLIAWLPRAKPHDAPIFLEELLSHPERLGYIQSLSELAHVAARGVQTCSLTDLAQAINGARVELQEKWSLGKGITSEVKAIVDVLNRELQQELLAWKLPGAGNSASLLILTTDLIKATSLFLDRGWVTIPVNVTRGIEAEWQEGRLIVRAGMRVDLVGGADLIHDQQSFPNSASVGACCSIALRPRSRFVKSVYDGGQ